MSETAIHRARFSGRDGPMLLEEAQSPYKADVWRKLTPRERLRRSWELRCRLLDARAVHDRKLFPKP